MLDQQGWGSVFAEGKGLSSPGRLGIFARKSNRHAMFEGSSRSKSIIALIMDITTVIGIARRLTQRLVDRDCFETRVSG